MIFASLIIKNGKTSVFPFFFVILRRISDSTALMKRKLLIFIIMMSAAAFVSQPVYAAAKDWEQPKTEHRDAKSIVKEAEIEILTAPSTIIVVSSHQVQIKVFSILGRLISAETLQPGTSQLTVGAHGVYIIKAGELTCKVAV